MKMSENGRELLSQWEGIKNNEYKDAAGLPTIGVGHLLTKEELASGQIKINDTPVDFHNGLADQQVMDLLAQDLIRFEDVVNSTVTATLTENQFDALVSFSFNVGTNAFKKSTLLRVLNEGQYQEVPNQLRRWVKAGGKTIQGLVNRRENEIELWNS